MAQVSVPLQQVPPSPATGMSRRAPLSNLPNAVNSPVQGSAAAKRSRSQSGIQREQPPTKKQATESSVLRTPRRNHAATVNDVERKVINNAAKKTVARKRPTQSAAPPTFADVTAQKNQQTVVTAWKKHYKKVFPTFVFYFDSVPPDVITEAKKHLSHLGATCEEFFSRRVTHVVTGRDLSGEDKKAAKGQREAAASSRNSGKGQDETGKRSGKDILNKAKEYEMRVWAIEKLEKVLNGLQDLPLGAPCLTNPGAVSAPTDRQQNIDISKVLREDKDPKASHELHYFKGPYIYVHDMFETHRPMLVKEWSKPQNGELGAWPQLHSVRDNKCPFVPASSEDREEDRRREAERRDREKARLQKMQYEVNQAMQKRERLSQTNPQPATVPTVPKATKPEDFGSLKPNICNPPAEPVPEEPLKEVKNVPERAPPVRPAVKAAAPPLQKAIRPRLEPVASGIQPSNVTSAIRSQMVSSHQDAPGNRAGMSKEIYALKRKAADNMLARAPVPTRKPSVAQMQTAEFQKPRHAQKAEPVIRKKPLPYAQEPVLSKPEKKMMKPGYCENCHVKFDDFDEHIQSRKHRKFALDDNNWAELDQLMSKLIRPLKDSIL